MTNFFKPSLFFSLFFLPFFVWGEVFVIEPNSNTVGKIRHARAQYGETLADIGIRYDMGLTEMSKANPNISAHQILSPDAKVIIPSRFGLPNVPRTGIVINLAEFRLYYFPPGENVVFTYPVGIGRKGWSTPTGVTKVIAKVRNPTWRPTPKLQAEGERNGVFVPDVFPPNEYNPLGKYALRLTWPTYLIHGTHIMGSIGERVSAGCIRMLPQDIEHLFEHVRIGTPVRVINQPKNAMG